LQKYCTDEIVGGCFLGHTSCASRTMLNSGTDLSDFAGRLCWCVTSKALWACRNRLASI